jgi:hypothetical protein
MEILSISIDGCQSCPAGKCKGNAAISGMLQDFRSVHAYHNSTTLIPGYQRILLGFSHPPSSKHRKALIRYHCYRRGDRFSTITTREDHNFDPSKPDSRF